VREPRPAYIARGIGWIYLNFALTEHVSPFFVKNNKYKKIRNYEK